MPGRDISERDTIFALSSGRPPAAIAVIRISGPQASHGLELLTGRLPEPRKAVLARVRNPRTQEAIDEAVALWFPGPRSETGEDTAELQLHGGQAVIAEVLEALGGIGGCRLAEPGEFTRRAFENGRLDLTEVEGLADLIAAETGAQRRQAFRQLKGLIGGRAERWRQELINALALVEARIDFADEADVPEDLLHPAVIAAQHLREEIAAVLAAGRSSERLRDGLVVAIAGPPNAGKSTLLNRLARREAAIVSPYPGTTRDVIEVHLDLGGYPVTILDTAGIRRSADPLEQEGIRRATERSAGADLVLWVTDAFEPSDPDQFSETLRTDGAVVWLLANKADLLPQATWAGKIDPKNEYGVIYLISAFEGSGIGQLIDGIKEFAAAFFSGAEAGIVTRARHRQILESVVASLDAAIGESASLSPRDEVVAEELRAAAVSLGRLTGRIDVEDVLDAIFSEFCIGK
jgi:tRNA modification GTPase